MPLTRALKVFLCHASQDKPAVRELYQRLSVENWIEPWLDEERISLGQHWTTAIEEALEAADIVLIFLSRNSVKKEGFVQRELNYAWELSLEKPQGVIFLIPLRLDDCEIPRHLKSRQWGNYFGDKEEKTYQDLLRSLKQRHQQKLQLEVEEHEQQESAEKFTREKAEREAKEKVSQAIGIDGDVSGANIFSGNRHITHVRPVDWVFHSIDTQNEKIAHEKAERESAENATLKIEEREAQKKAALKNEKPLVAQKAKEKRLAQAKVEFERKAKEEEQTARAKTQRESQEKPKMRAQFFCTNCGTSLPLGQAYCLKCMQPFMPRSCPHCKKENVPQNTLYCPDCGKRV